MKIAHKYSHLNGEEYLLVHHTDLYNEIKEVIQGINADKLKTKISKERTKKGKSLYSPIDMNNAFHKSFSERGWSQSVYSYYVTLNRDLMEKSLKMPPDEMRRFLIENGEDNPIYSYNQTDFVKSGIAIEVQFGKYAFVAFDLFVKHMLFFTGGKIDLGIEILPTKVMQSKMSSGVAWYEKEVYNIMRQGRSSPPVPLLILGIEP